MVVAHRIILGWTRIFVFLGWEMQYTIHKLL